MLRKNNNWWLWDFNFFCISRKFINIKFKFIDFFGVEVLLKNCTLKTSYETIKSWLNMVINRSWSFSLQILLYWPLVEFSIQYLLNKFRVSLLFEYIAWNYFIYSEILLLISLFFFCLTFFSVFFSVNPNNLFAVWVFIVLVTFVGKRLFNLKSKTDKQWKIFIK